MKIPSDIMDWLRDLDGIRSFLTRLFLCSIILCVIGLVITFATECYYANHDIKEYEKLCEDIYIIGGCGIIVQLLLMLLINVAYLFD